MISAYARKFTTYYMSHDAYVTIGRNWLQVDVKTGMRMAEHKNAEILRNLAITM